MAKKPTVSTTFNAKNKLSGPLAKMKKQVAGFAKAAAVGFGVAAVAIGRATLKFAESGDQIAKTASKLGVTAEELQELRFAADRSGASAETLDNALGKMNKNVGDLRAGTGALNTLLNKTNPALAEQLKNASGNAEAFEIMSDALSNTENDFDKAALAQAAFGRAGMELINLTADGADGVKALREEAKKYGGIISNDAAKSSEKFMDSLTNMKASFQGVLYQGIGPLVEKFQPYLQQMAEYISANKDLIGQKIEKVFQAVEKTVKTLVILWDSGLLPALIAGASAFYVLTKAMAAGKAAIELFKVAQIALNFAMSANPVGLIIVGVAFLIGLIALIVIKWDEWGAAIGTWMGIISPAYAIIFGIVAIVKELQMSWAGISAAFTEGGFIEGIKTIGATITQMILKPVEQVLGLLSKIPGVGEKFAKMQSNVNSAMSNNREYIDRYKPISENSGGVKQSNLNVNFANAPAGTSFSQKGTAPGININTGQRGGL